LYLFYFFFIHHNGLISMNELINYIMTNVVQLTKGVQEPALALSNFRSLQNNLFVTGLKATQPGD